MLKEYSERLRVRPMRPDLKDYGEMRKQVFNKKIIQASKIKSDLWTMCDLNIVLRHLKSNISRDQDGYLNELFKPDCIGDNLRESLLLLMNKLKKHILIPYIMLSANVTTTPKIMMVGKNKDEIYSDNFYVDKWKVTHQENLEGG